MSESTTPKEGDTKVIPLGILLIGLLVGGTLLSTFPTGEDAFVSWALIGLCALGVLYVGIGFKGEYEEGGLHSAVNWLFSGPPSTNSGRKSDTSSSTEKTPPAPEKLKNELIFERANRECEWCGKRTDTPEVHHIKPRSEGGPNSRRNLIVLCPGCHRKAGGRIMGRSKLTYRVREQIGKEES